MDFVKKWKRVLKNNKRSLYKEESGSGSYGKLRDNNKRTPNGCLCVYVGPQRQRFIIKIKICNHPLFKTLLEAVENEYGYTNDGPLWIPCDVDLFCEAISEIESVVDDMNFVGCISPMGHKHSSHFNKTALKWSNLSCDVNYEFWV